MTIRPGTICKFNYPEQFHTLPLYSHYRNKTVIVFRAMHGYEADGPAQGCEQMYLVRAEDGTMLEAFESELDQL
jgi:deoxyribodipyrimidine photolyase-like uncharacterized protein